MSGTPVVVVTSGGIAVTEVENGAPLSVADNGFGMAVTIVASGGMPVTFVGGGAPAAPELPTGALGLYVYSDYEAPADGYKLVPNRMVAGTDRDPNIMGFPRRVFSSPSPGGVWARSAVTITDCNQLAPDGSMEASTVTWAAGVDAFFYRDVTVPTGGGIFCFSIKNLDATTPIDLTVGSLFGTNGTKTLPAGAAWTRMTLAVPAGASSMGIRAKAAGPAANFAICDLEVFAGGVDLRAATWNTAKPLCLTRGDMLIGENRTTAGRGVVGGVLPAGANRGYIQFDQLRTMSEFTVISVIKKTTGSMSDVWQGLMEAMLLGSQSQTYNNFCIGPAAPTIPSIKLNGVNTADRSVPSAQDQNSSSMWGANKSGPFVTMHRWDGTTGSSWLNGVKLLERTSTITPPSLGDFMVNRSANTNSPLDQYALLVYSRALSDAEMVQAYQWLDAEIPALTAARKRLVIGEGDSITFQNTSYGEFILDAYGIKPAVPGDSTVGLNTRAAGNDAILTQAAALDQTGVLCVLIGANSLGTSGSTAAGDTFLASLQAYLAARKAAGWEVVLCTITPQNSAGFNTIRNYVNPIMRTWVGTYCDAIADYAADPTIGTDAAGANVTYYSDGVHMTAAAYAISNPILGAAVASLG